MILNKLKAILPLIVVLSGIVAFNFSCVLDDTSPNPIIPHNISSFNQLFLDSAFQVQYNTVNASEDMVFTSANGSNVKLEANSLLDENGTTATGAVEIQLVELLTKSDRLFSAISLAKDDGTLLEALGGFHISAWKNESSLDVAEALTLRFEDYAGIYNNSSELSVFYPNSDAGRWEEANDQLSNVLVENVAGGEILTLTANQLGWIAAAQPYVPNNNTTTLSLTSNRNSPNLIDQKAFVVFDDINSIVALEKNGLTYAAAGLPIGENASVIVMAFDENQFYLDYEQVTISENLFLEMQLGTYTPSGLIQALKAIN